MFITSVRITGKAGISDMSIMKAITTWENEVAPELLAEIRRRAPQSDGPGSGRLRDSMYISRRSTGRGLEARIMSSAPYAKFVTQGTAAHTIEPRTALALHWVSKGSDAFARRVNHPGTRPNLFVQKAVAAMMPLMARKLRERTQEEFH